jgi:PAS domain S-box-containing protein
MDSRLADELWDEIPDAILAMAPDGCVLFWNRAAASMFGYSRAEALGRSLTDLIVPADRADDERRLRIEVEASNFLMHESVRRRKDAALVHVGISSKAIKDSNGKLRYILSTFREVQLNELVESRVEQRTDVLDAANKELEAFSFTVSHDLRAPLRRISGFAHLLEEKLSPTLGEEREFLAQIINGTAQMDHLIEALLEFARTSRTEMHFREVDLEGLLDEAVALLHLDFERRKIELRRRTLPTVRGHATLLRQVFINLLSNAVKYTRTREAAVIEVGARREGENEVIFIRDNGVGFDMRYAEKLFGVFQRLHRADEFEGTGVGLANVKRIVTRHGGAIWAEAQIGQGATFYFSLPRM